MTIRENPKTIRETITIPAQTRERMLNLDHPAAEPLLRIHLNLSGISDLTPGYEVGRINSTHHQLLYTLGGAGRFFTPSQNLKLCPGELLMIPGRQTYGYEIDGPTWRIMWFHFDLRESFWFLGEDPFVHRPSMIMPRLEAVTDGYLVESLQESPPARHAARLYADLIAHYLERELGWDKDPVTRKIHERLYRLWDTVNGNLQKPWTVEELAANMHMSKAHLHRTCLQFCGMSPMQKVTQLRMQRAEALLRRDYPIKAISDMVGYQSPYSFSVAFKRHTGLSPGQYRQQR